ncbi:xylulokinase [bacterium]|nr:xylulokinase [bacterium]
MFFIGIDLGTSGVKVLLIDEKGEVVSKGEEEYPLYTPNPGWTEQDPQEWWSATKTAIRKAIKDVNPNEIKGIGLTGQMHGSVFLDDDGNVIRPCILWNDQRTYREVEEIMERFKDKVVEWIANPVLTGFTLPKIVWLRKNEPENFSKVRKILLPKDYIRFKLTGEYATEVSDASGTALFDVKNRTWSREMIEAMGLSLELFPKCYESPEVTGYVTREVAEETGLKEGIPVVGGGGDQAAQAVGMGIVHSYDTSVTLGTSGVVFSAINEVFVDPRLRTHTFCHAVPGMWHIMGVMLSAGGSLRWYRDTFSEMETSIARLLNKDPYEILTAEAERVKPGSERLLFLPYLTGERCPYPDPFARGVFFGIGLNHSRAHFVRAIIEGISFGLNDSLNILRELGVKPSMVKVSGGGARSLLWRKILASIFQLPVATINVTEGAAFGSALLSAVGIGQFGSVIEAVENIVRITDVTEPEPNWVKIYEELYPLYKKLYEDLKEDFRFGL